MAETLNTSQKNSSMMLRYTFIQSRALTFQHSRRNEQNTSIRSAKQWSQHNPRFVSLTTPFCPKNKVVDSMNKFTFQVCQNTSCRSSAKFLLICFDYHIIKLEDFRIITECRSETSMACYLYTNLSVFIYSSLFIAVYNLKNIICNW